MWFKTRTGFFQVTEPLEIRIGKYPKLTPPVYCIFARSLKDQEFQYKGIFGNAKGSTPTIWLAQFHLSDSRAAVTNGMKLIEDAIRAEAKICDLSAVGDADAWPKSWDLVDWQQKSNNET